MEVPFAEALRVAHRVCASGGRVVWNFAPAPVAFAASDLSELIGTTDVFVVNEHEAFAAAAILGFATGDFEEAGAYLSRTGGCICVVTAGARGAFAFHPDGTREMAAADPIKPVDTTGAGDTFVGILAAGLGEKLPFKTALARACHGASLACLAHGAQGGMPTREQLNSRTISLIPAGASRWVDTRTLRRLAGWWTTDNSRSFACPHCSRQQFGNSPRSSFPAGSSPTSRHGCSTRRF